MWTKFTKAYLGESFKRQRSYEYLVPVTDASRMKLMKTCLASHIEFTSRTELSLNPTRTARTVPGVR